MTTRGNLRGPSTVEAFDDRSSTTPRLSNLHPMQLPDLLSARPSHALDRERVEELLERAFLGRDAAEELDRELAASAATDAAAGWELDLFAEDLFVRDLIADHFAITIDRLRFPPQSDFLFAVLSRPPVDPDDIAFRQSILRELEADPALERRLERLYREIFRFVDLLKQEDRSSKLDPETFRLDVLHQAKTVVETMADGFATSTSGLVRLHEAALEMRDGRAYRRLAALLDFEERQTTATLRVDLGVDGEIRRLAILDLEPNRASPFRVAWWKRAALSVVSFGSGHRLDRKVLVRRLLGKVFRDVLPDLVPLVQILGHLEVYLAARAFRRRMAEHGLDTSLAEIGDDLPVSLDALFNPLLVGDEAPRPCDLAQTSARRTTLVTGPNSGGKTRLLQSAGLAQLLGQSGLYVPARRAQLPLVRGLFVSLVETETAQAAEGRLGRELLRIRRLFSRLGSPSMVVLDELCSGTNPSEGAEIFRLVLELLERLGSVAFISTHFLELAQSLERERPLESLEFLRVEIDEGLRSTYQFVSGVARTSLAAETARRLGVTFEQLSALIDRRRAP
ncbi:MAG: DNA mismatch repair protein [Acidobacteriota bacterium]